MHNNRIAELAEEKAKKAEFDAMPLNKRFAIYLHKKCCGWNHTDGCGWYYKEHDWEEYAHMKYLKKSNKLLALTKDVDMLMCIIDIIEEV